MLEVRIEAPENGLACNGSVNTRTGEGSCINLARITGAVTIDVGISTGDDLCTNSERISSVNAVLWNVCGDGVDVVDLQ